MFRADGVEVILLTLELGEGMPMMHLFAVKALGRGGSGGCGGKVLIGGSACLSFLMHGTDVLDK